MSGTTRAYECGLLQPVAFPAAIDAVAPPLWPLHERLVFDRTPQPASEMLGAPPKFIPTSDSALPLSNDRMQEFSGVLDMATDAAAMSIADIDIARMNMVATLALTVAE